MSGITKAYIDNHMHAVHTYESFGRAIAEQILNAAGRQAGENEIQRATISAEFAVTAYEKLECVRICGTIEGVTVCYHVG